MTPAELDALADTEQPQGIIAVIEPRVWSLEDIPTRPGDVVLVLDAVQDPGNVGTMLRTALALGASGVVALKGTADLTVRAPEGPQPQTPEEARALGAAWWPLRMARELDDALLRLRFHQKARASRIGPRELWEAQTLGGLLRGATLRRGRSDGSSTERSGWNPSSSILVGRARGG